MTQARVKKIPKFYIFATLILLFPVFLVGMAFLAAKSDAETKRKYDQLLLEQEARTALRKQQEQQQSHSNVVPQP